MTSQKPSPIGAKSRSLSVPQDTKSNPSNGLVERVARIILGKTSSFNRDGFDPLEKWTIYPHVENALSKAREIHALYQQEEVLSSQRGEDWALVPREPTIEQQGAGNSAFIEIYGGGRAVRAALIRAVYRGMLNASPTPPASQRGENRSANASPSAALLGANLDAEPSAQARAPQEASHIVWTTQNDPP